MAALACTVLKATPFWALVYFGNIYKKPTLAKKSQDETSVDLPLFGRELPRIPEPANLWVAIWMSYWRFGDRCSLIFVDS